MIMKETKTKRDILKKQNDMHVYQKKDMWNTAAIAWWFYEAWDAHFPGQLVGLFQYRQD